MIKSSVTEYDIYKWTTLFHKLLNNIYLVKRAGSFISGRGCMIKQLERLSLVPITEPPRPSQRTTSSTQLWCASALTSASSFCLLHSQLSKVAWTIYIFNKLVTIYNRRGRQTHYTKFRCAYWSKKVQCNCSYMSVSFNSYYPISENIKLSWQMAITFYTWNWKRHKTFDGYKSQISSPPRKLFHHIFTSLLIWNVPFPTIKRLKWFQWGASLNL